MEININAIECIKTRRSVRKFKDQAVSTDVIAEIVNVAAYAPSWKSSQTTRYTAVIDKSLKDRLANECMMGFEYNVGTASGAPARRYCEDVRSSDLQSTGWYMYLCGAS